MAPSEFAEADVERVRQANPLDQVINDRVRLRPAGDRQYKGSCPFHADQFASMKVAPAVRGGRYHCFECSADGDVFDFLMSIDGLTYSEAVTRLAARAEITLPPPADNQS